MKETQLLQDLKNTTIIQLYARAEAPCRDYYGLTVAEKYVRTYFRLKYNSSDKTF